MRYLLAIAWVAAIGLVDGPENALWAGVIACTLLTLLHMAQAGDGQ